MLEQMSYEFLNLGIDVNIVAINKADALETQEGLIEQCSFPLLQDTDDIDAWGKLDGGKDDFYIYQPDGQLAIHFPSGGSIATNLSSGPGYSNLRDTVLAVVEEGTSAPSAP